MALESAREYARVGNRSVQGWLNAFAAEVIVRLGTWQLERGVRGAVGEIGVHHGRLFVLLDLLRRADERSVAIDVFDQQHLNQDESGRGDLQRFLANVDRWVGGHDHLHVISTSSAAVTPEQITRAVGLLRMMSVDGGHTDVLTLNDLRLADAVLDPGGVVIMDDVFNERWPGVVTGLTAYLAESSAALVPVGIASNKVFLCRPDAVESYSSALHQPGWTVKAAAFMGHPVSVLWRQPPPGRLATAYRWTQDKPVVGSMAQRLRRALR